MPRRQPRTADPLGGAEHTHLLARVGQYTIAIPIEAVISVHPAPLVFSVPCAQPGIAGAIRYAGNAIPVFDLRKSLRLAPKETAENDRLILVDVKVRIMAFVVDEVLEFVSIERFTDETPAALFGDSPVNTNIIAGIACAPDVCAVIDMAGVLLPDTWDVPALENAYQETANQSHPLWARTAALAEPPKAAAAAGVEAAIFQIGGQRFAVTLPLVVEFFTQTAHNPIPVRCSLAISLLNRRGQAVTLFDPRPILGLPATRLPALLDGLVLFGGDYAMAIAVDQLEGLDVLSASDSSARPGRFCLSVHPSPRGPILLLDVFELLRHAHAAIGNREPAASAVA
jgi:chemotaxis signal transduction protein